MGEEGKEKGRKIDKRIQEGRKEGGGAKKRRRGEMERGKKKKRKEGRK